MRRTRIPNVRVRKPNKHRKYRPFPYQRVAKMWKQGMTIAQIGRAVNRVDKNNPNDPYHSLRNFLCRMHKGYNNGKGKVVKLPHRISKAALQAARKAGLRAW